MSWKSSFLGNQSANFAVDWFVFEEMNSLDEIGRFIDDVLEFWER